LGAAVPGRRHLTFPNGWMRLDLWPSAGSSPSPFPRQLISSGVPTSSSGVPTIIFTPSTGTVTTNNSATYYGLPAIGFAATSSPNGLLTAPGTSQPVLANYGEARMTRNTNRLVSP